ncbi:MAG: sodium:solute symporter [Peptostreptococcaceae bacterium]|nr:sodium:solute symporter [Peptostreptococcaceae bacterium]
MVSGIDYLIIIIYFVFLLSAGFVAMKKAKSKDDYLVAGRMLPLPMFTACMAAVVIGGGCTLGGAELAYKNGISAIWLGIMYALGVGLLGFFMSTKMANMRILSTNEGVGLFYGKQARLVSALVTLIYIFMIAVLQVVGMGSIIHALLGWSIQVSMVAGGSIVLVYLFVGGMWAVAFTDIIQFVIMTVGVLILGPYFALHAAGGVDGLTSTLPASYFDMTALGWPRITAYILLLVPGFMVGQDIWQKAFTAKNPKVAKKGIMLASGYILLYAVGTVIFGICLYAVNPGLTDTKLAFAVAAITFMPPGVKGLVLAAALAAIMSTANGGILGSSTVIYNDIICRYIKVPEKNEIWVNRFLAAGVTVLTVIVALWLQSVLVALDVAYAYLSGCVFVPLVAAFILKRVSARAGLYSLCASFVTVTFFFFKDGLTALTPIQYGIAVSLIVFFVVNAIDKKKTEIIFDNGTVIDVALQRENAEI